MKLCFCIEIDPTFFITFSKYNAFSSFKINIRNIQIHQFTNTYTCWIKQINHSQIPRTLTMISKHFNCLIWYDFFYRLFRFNFVNAPHRAFQNVIFFLKPRKETRNISSHIIHCYFTTIIDFLIINEIFSNFLCWNFSHRCLDFLKHFIHCYTIILNRSIRTSFNTFCI